MSNTRVAIGSAAIILLSTLAPAGLANAAPSKQVQLCLAPISSPERSADVIQGWIDGCREDGRL